MAQIPNFPQNLLDMHHHWHDPSMHSGSPGGRVHPFGTAGGGLEFLQFHRDFVASFHAWYDTQAFGTAPFNVAPFQNAAAAAAAVVPWTSVPAALKNPAVTGWGSVQATQESRLATLSPPFASADDLGNYIEGGIHGWIHGATAAAYNEPVVGTFHSPLSTYFYGIHGLVDYWWRQWQAIQKRPLKDIIDSKVVMKEIKEHKEFVKEKDFVKEHKEKDFVKDHKEIEKIVKEIEKAHEKPIKEKDKDLVEGGLPQLGGDPEVLNQLAQRVGDLETRMAVQSFIQPQERPDVGNKAMNAAPKASGKKKR
jgi:hypothetical protein